MKVTGDLEVARHVAIKQSVGPESPPPELTNLGLHLRIRHDGVQLALDGHGSLTRAQVDDAVARVRSALMRQLSPAGGDAA